MTGNPIHLLVIEDEEFDVRRIRNTLRLFEEQIRITNVVSNGRDALELLERDSGAIDVVIMDFQLSGGLHGEELIRRIRRIDPALQIIVVTKMTINQTDLYFANQLLGSGAYWYCTKYPGDIEEYIYQPTDFILNIMNAFEKRRLELERNRSLKKLDNRIHEIIAHRPIIGQSPAIERVKRLIAQYADADASILITGESGTGKELVAINTHYNSPRKYENFVTINCGAIPLELVESELFGFEKGSFTDAKQSKPGLFEQADGGTIFLDEISELPLSVQSKLLRVLQSGEIEKIGRQKQHVVNVRVIAATNRELEQLTASGQFREDLYYRINVLQINVPPLRDRREDIPLIVEHLLEFYSRDMGIMAPTLKTGALQQLVAYDWPGNVRQLKNIIQRLLLINRHQITPETVIEALGLSGSATAEVPGTQSFTEIDIAPLREVERDFRKRYFQFVRERSNSDAEAARRLGLAPPNFYRMCKELNLK